MTDVKGKLLTILAALLLFAAGVGGYSCIEGWNFLDSLYMTVITLGTVAGGRRRQARQGAFLRALERQG